jgi:hypothetical protein
VEQSGVGPSETQSFPVVCEIASHYDVHLASEPGDRSFAICSARNPSGPRRVSHQSSALLLFAGSHRPNREAFTVTLPREQNGSSFGYAHHMKHIMNKLRASNRTQSVAIAARRGIIQL